ncbi:hypothetical protein N657DRAFT_674020 [Parathielavia appendiculata]|uniref:Uncharacterized protein n=1 Tax=Parathielavia appendiculata TaxID=2587402 RepID=A0AAN6TUJ7_9PEZI|nr:hypothetical protein N657DRAFT_674020 [Parathielavia appendiculata]
MDREDKNQAQFAATLKGKTYFLSDFGLTRQWSQALQSSRRIQRPSERDRKQERREALLFKGDGEPDELGPRPLVAWTWLWNDMYSNLYGEYIPRVLHLWGQKVFGMLVIDFTVQVLNAADTLLWILYPRFRWQPMNRAAASAARAIKRVVL